MTQRWSRLLPYAIVALVGCRQNALGDSGSADNQALELTLKPIDAEVSHGEPIAVDLRLRNRTGHSLPLVVMLDWPSNSVLIDLTGPTGEVLQSRAPVGIYRHMNDVTDTLTLPARGEISHRYTLTGPAGRNAFEFPFSTPGPYRVQVKIMASLDGGHEFAMLKSTAARILVRD